MPLFSFVLSREFVGRVSSVLCNEFSIFEVVSEFYSKVALAANLIIYFIPNRTAISCQIC